MAVSKFLTHRDNWEINYRFKKSAQYSAVQKSCLYFKYSRKRIFTVFHAKLPTFIVRVVIVQICVFLFSIVGPILFLEDDHYVAEDFIYMLKLMEKSCSVTCPQCSILSLGTYLKTYSFYGEAKVCYKFVLLFLLFIFLRIYSFVFHL